MRFLIQVNYLADTNCNFVLTPQTTPPPNDYSNTHEGNSIAKDNDKDTKLWSRKIIKTIKLHLT